VLRLLRVLGRARGCLLMLEDLHWADPETLAVLEYLADHSSSERLLCVATLRAERSGAALELAAALDSR
jgi:predicted ATPase